MRRRAQELLLQPVHTFVRHSTVVPHETLGALCAIRQQPVQSGGAGELGKQLDRKDGGNRCKSALIGTLLGWSASVAQACSSSRAEGASPIAPLPLVRDELVSLIHTAI